MSNPSESEKGVPKPNARCGGGATKNAMPNFARNQLKRLDSDERIQGNPSFSNPS
jgi:hypothetical protein